MQSYNITTKEKVVKALCMFCMNRCGVEVLVRNGEIVKISPDRDSRTRGFVCQRLRLAALDYHNHPRRLNYPLKRIGNRGQGRWERVSWQQAMDEVGEKIKQIRDTHGPEAIAVMMGDRASVQSWLALRWANLFGTPNRFLTTLN